MTLYDKYKDNEKLLDNKREWHFLYDPEATWTQLKGKIVVGFLQDSHENVIGEFQNDGESRYEGGKKDFKYNRVGIVGYACSHFRRLSKEEIDFIKSLSHEMPTQASSTVSPMFPVITNDGNDKESLLKWIAFTVLVVVIIIIIIG